MSRRCTRRRRIGGLVALALCALAAAGCGTGNADGDGQVVFCLAPAHRDQLVDAATALGLAGRGTAERPIGAVEGPRTVEEWRAGHGRDFDTACEAIAPPPPSNGLVAGLIGAANALVGGFIGYLFASWTARRARRLQAADSVRDAAQRLDATARDMIFERTREGGPGPTLSQLVDRATELESTLRRAGSENPRAGGRIVRLRTLVDELVDTFTAPWPSDTSEVQDRASTARVAVGRIVDEAESVVREVGGQGRVLPRCHAS